MDTGYRLNPTYCRSIPLDPISICRDRCRFVGCLAEDTHKFCCLQHRQMAVSTHRPQHYFRCMWFCMGMCSNHCYWLQGPCSYWTDRCDNHGSGYMCSPMDIFYSLFHPEKYRFFENRHKCYWQLHYIADTNRLHWSQKQWGCRDSAQSHFGLSWFWVCHFSRICNHFVSICISTDTCSRVLCCQHTSQHHMSIGRHTNQSENWCSMVRHSCSCCWITCMGVGRNKCTTQPCGALIPDSRCSLSSHRHSHQDKYNKSNCSCSTWSVVSYSHRRKGLSSLWSTGCMAIGTHTNHWFRCTAANIEDIRPCGHGDCLECTPH